MNVQTLVIQVRLGPTLKFVLNTHTDTQATHTHACMHTHMYTKYIELIIWTLGHTKTLIIQAQIHNHCFPGNLMKICRIFGHICQKIANC